MATKHPELRTQLDLRAARFVDEHRLAGASAGIVEGANLAWAGGYGYVDLNEDAVPDESTLYRIASITKTFTGSALLQLRDEGLLSLDDPLLRHLPELADAHNPFGSIESVTLRRLLMHESGLMCEAPGARPDDLFFPSADDILRGAGAIRVAIPPDSAPKYSNLAFALLGEVVARASGAPYTEYVRARILEPLAMSSTTFDPRGALRERTARGYDARRFSDDLTPARRLRPAGIEADGGLFSTVADLGRWISFQLGAADAGGHDGVLRRSSRREMQRPGVVTNDDWTEAQGLVWYSTRRGGTVLLGHDGSLNGFSTSIRFSVRDGIGAIALLNGVGPASDLAFDLASAFMSQRVPTPPERARRRPIPEAWRDLPGTYADLEFGDEARVEWRGNELVIQSEDAFRRLEETEDPLTFVVRGGRSSGEPVVFERGEAGVRGLRLLTYPYVKLS